MCAASISADSARVVTGSGDKLARVWDASRFPRQTLALVMALHPRLSAGCPARELDPEILQVIGEQVVAPCWASTPAEGQGVFTSTRSRRAGGSEA
jgi:hypothetical protein